MRGSASRSAVRASGPGRDETMTVFVELTEEGVRRVLDGKPGMVFVVDHTTNRLGTHETICHVRDPQKTPYQPLGSDQLWTLGPEDYEFLKSPERRPS